MYRYIYPAGYIFFYLSYFVSPIDPPILFPPYPVFVAALLSRYHMPTPYCSYTICLSSILAIYYLSIRSIWSILFGYAPYFLLRSVNFPFYYPYSFRQLIPDRFYHSRVPDGAHFLFAIKGAFYPPPPPPPPHPRRPLPLPFSRIAQLYLAISEFVTLIKYGNR